MGCDKSMTDKPSAFHSANCRVDDCDWGTLRTSMIGIFGDLEDHLKDDHGYTDAEWRESRNELESAREGTRQMKLSAIDGADSE